MKLFSYLLQLGITPQTPVADAKHIKMTNVLNISSILIIALPVFITAIFLPYPFNGQASLIRFELLIFFAVFNLILNHYGFYLWAKIQTIVFHILLIFVFPFITGYVHEGMLLWMPYGIITIGSFSFSLFSFSKERKLMIFILVSAFMFSVLFDNMFVALTGADVKAILIVEYYVIYKLAITIINILVYGNLYLFKRNNHLIQKELDYKNTLLTQLNETLEEQVVARTHKINEQNHRIKELAFTNSHLLRASVTRTIGLTRIFKTITLEEDRIFCLQKIEDSVKEMDTITRALSINLEIE